jgi:pimeloyl-ACP methyl ester carboxylesterase
LLVVGWCWGAALAVALTRKLGDRVSGLVLLTPGIWNTAAVKDAMAAQADRLATAAPDAPVIDSPIDEAWFTDGPAKDGFIRTDARRLRRITPRMVEVSGRLATSAAAALRTLQTPLLVVLADDDQATDNDATRAGVEALPADRRRIVTLPSKHGVQFDAPDPVARHLTAFASDLGL